MFAKDFSRRPMRCLIAVERDLLWQPAGPRTYPQ